MRGINRITLLGNVGKDPSIKVLGSGDKISTFPLATTEMWKKDGNPMEETQWHNIICWKEIADSVEASELKKSDRVYLEGKVKSRKFKNKEGAETFVTEIVVDHFTIVSRYKVKETANEDI